MKKRITRRWWMNCKPMRSRPQLMWSRGCWGTRAWGDNACRGRREGRARRHRGGSWTFHLNLSPRRSSGTVTVRRGNYAEAKHEEDVLEVFPKVQEGCEVQPRTGDVDMEPPSTPMIIRANAPKSPAPGVSHILPASVTPKSTSSSCHYSRLKPTKAPQTLVGFQLPIR